MTADQISIEAAQPLDLGVLKDLSNKKILLGVIDLANPDIESANIIADQIRHGLKYVCRSPDSGTGLRDEIHAARRRLRN